MAGNVYKNPENNGGGWGIQWEVPSVGKRDRHTKIVHGSKRDAQKLLRDILSSIDNKEYISRDKQTFGEYLAEYLASRVGANNLSPNTTSNMHYYFNNIHRRDVQYVPLQDVTKHDIQKVIDELIELKRAPNYMKNLCKFLYTAFEWAVDDNKILRNPMQGSNKGKRKTINRPKVNSKGDVPIWSLAQMDSYLQQSRDDKHSPYLDAYGLILWTGLRRGEVCGLKWSAIDLDKAVLSVTNNRTDNPYGPGYIELPPKTEAGWRTISLSEDCVKFLRRSLNDQENYRLENPTADSAWPDDPYVICNPDGTLFGPKILNRNFTKMCNRYGLPHSTPHKLRHTHASLLYADGANMLELAQRLGHASVQTTMDIYTHLFEDPMLGSEKLQGLDRMLRGIEGLE